LSMKLTTSFPFHNTHVTPSDHEVAVLFVRPQFPQPWVKDDFVAVVMVMVLHPNENEMTNCQLGKRDI